MFLAVVDEGGLSSLGRRIQSQSGVPPPTSFSRSRRTSSSFSPLLSIFPHDTRRTMHHPRDTKLMSLVVVCYCETIFVNRISCDENGFSVTKNGFLVTKMDFSVTKMDFS